MNYHTQSENAIERIISESSIQIGDIPEDLEKTYAGFWATALGIVFAIVGALVGAHVGIAMLGTAVAGTVLVSLGAGLVGVLSGAYFGSKHKQKLHNDDLSPSQALSSGQARQIKR